MKDMKKKRAICLLRKAEEMVWDSQSAMNKMENLLSEALDKLYDREEICHEGKDSDLAVYADEMYRVLREIVYTKDPFALFLAKEGAEELLERIEDTTE